MAIWDKIRGEFIDVIDWTDATPDTIVWKFPRYNNEIKMGAKLTVRESQVAVFMNEGTIADVFGPGMYELSTQNMPIMTTLRSWKFGFNSPFKADVFFVSTRQFTDQKWGTKNPVMLRDAEFGPVRLRAFGSFAFRVKDAAVFLKEIASTNPEFSTEDVIAHLRNIAVSRGMDAIAESKIPVLDLAANYDESSAGITQKIGGEFTEIGLTLTKFLIENISLPPEVEAVLDKRSGMGIVGNLGAYAQFQAANALEAAADNAGGGGIMGAGVGLGMGAAVGGQMAGVFGQNQFNPQTGISGGGTAAPAAGAPPPLPEAVQYYAALKGKQAGPFGADALRDLIGKGQLTPDTLVWKSGMTGWTAAKDVGELSALFTAMPPPLPGA